MVYAYMQLARDNDANQALQDARRVANINPNNPTTAYALAAMPARIAIERGMWKEAAQLELRSSKVPHTDAMTQFAAPSVRLAAVTLPRLRRVCRN